MKFFHVFSMWQIKSLLILIYFKVTYRFLVNLCNYLILYFEHFTLVYIYFQMIKETLYVYHTHTHHIKLCSHLFSSQFTQFSSCSSLCFFFKNPSFSMFVHDVEGVLSTWNTVCKRVNLFTQFRINRCVDQFDNFKQKYWEPKNINCVCDYTLFNQLSKNSLNHKFMDLIPFIIPKDLK